VRRGLVMVINLASDLTVVGEFSNGTGAVDAIETLNPDVVILDMKMPVMDGRTAALRIKRRWPEVKVLMLSGAPIDEDVLDVLDAGVDGYVLKDIGPDHLIEVIRKIAHGERFVQPQIELSILKMVEVDPPAHAAVKLTPRENEVLHLLATSATYEEIGRQLNISEETVRSHAKGILAKLDQPNRTMAVVAAVRLGLIDLMNHEHRTGSA
jgi:DNA-binding NarL/FixJ family response regulator